MTADRPIPIWKLALLLYPFTAGAVAINLFMVALLAPVIGLESFSPVTSLKWSVFLGLPATWAAARWVRRLMDEADDQT